MLLFTLHLTDFIVLETEIGEIGANQWDNLQTVDTSNAPV